MADDDRIRDGLAAAIGGVLRGSAVATRLCAAAVELLDVDGALVAISVDGNEVSRALGWSGAVSESLLDLEFTLGEGPLLQVISTSAPVTLADLSGDNTARWPVFTGAASALGVRALFVLPVVVAGFPVGVLLLYRLHPGPLRGVCLSGAFFAAELAALPVLDVMGMDLDAAVDDHTSHAWAELAMLTRSEVYQAVGVLIVRLGVNPAVALVRLRAHAFAHGRTTSETAYDILEHRVYLIDDGPHDGTDGGASW